MGMKCYYEILNVSQDATDDDLKKSYRKLALRWHPDKNLEHVEEAKEKFQLVQQAYEVLSDPQERAWYDRHRDSILKGGLGKDYNDESLNLYPYFTTACFKGYGDDEKGFYSVYREVFNQLSAEDSEYNSDLDSDEEIPDFGDSKSSYEDKVHSFYSYWQSYATKKSFSWLDEYDTRTAQNRRVAKLMEKENKKIRDGARKERNEEIRTLVAFVRKRDKRVLEYAKVLEERAALNADKVIQQKLKQKQQRQEEIRQQIETQSEWSKFSNLEKELKEIEENLAAEFNDHLSEECTTDEEDTESNHLGNLYCSACNKLFKTEQAFVNHEKSKKHRENVEEMSFNDASLESPEEEGKTTPDDVSSVHSDNISVSSQLLDSPPPSPTLNSKKNKKKRKNKQLHTVVSDSDTENNDTLTNLQNDSDSEFDTKRGKSKRNRKKANVEGEKPTVDDTASNETANDCGEIAEKSESKKSKGKKDKVKKEKTAPSDGQQALPRSADQKPSKTEPIDTPKDHTCKACTVSFKSNNELFKHLKKTGHALPPSSDASASSARLQTKTRRKK